MERVEQLRQLATEQADQLNLKMLEAHREVMQRNNQILGSETPGQLADSAQLAAIYEATKPSDTFPEMPKPVLGRRLAALMIILGGVMLLAGGSIVLMVIVGRQLVKLKYRARNWSWSHFEAKFKRRKLPIYVDGRRYSIGTPEYFEPVEMSLFDVQGTDATIWGVSVPQLRAEFLG